MTDTTPIPKSIFLTPPSQGFDNPEFITIIAKATAMISCVMALRAIEHIEIDHNNEPHECQVQELLYSFGTLYTQASEILREHNKPVPKINGAIDEYINHLFKELSDDGTEIEKVTRTISWLKNNRDHIREKFREVQKTPRDPNALPISVMLDITGSIAELAQPNR